MDTKEAIKKTIRQLSISRYSNKTIATYKSLLSNFFNHFKGIDPELIAKEEILNYMVYLVERGYSPSLQNQAINAIKYFYEKIPGFPREYYFVERPRRERKLPVILSRDEVKKIFTNVSNIKHKCLLMLLYSSGLRISEALNIRHADIDSKRMLIHIRSAKGKKDRYVTLSRYVLILLRDYFRAYRPNC